MIISISESYTEVLSDFLLYDVFPKRVEFSTKNVSIINILNKVKEEFLKEIPLKKKFE